MAAGSQQPEQQPDRPRLTLPVHSGSVVGLITPIIDLVVGLAL
jgi:hypothetical protein